uniref:Oxysterol-binding protein n=1 Tax=Romanomermis culicivorax TaxID=13658 RepID=A0A915K2Z2_ROMCU
MKMHFLHHNSCYNISDGSEISIESKLTTGAGRCRPSSKRRTSPCPQTIMTFSRIILQLNGFVLPFRNQAEVGHTCRGSINLQGAFIHTEIDSSTFVISNGATQTFHLKASNEVERQKWVTTLELARVRAIKAAESEEEEEMKLENEAGELESHGDLLNTLRSLQVKIDDLTTCQGLIVKHGNSLQKSLVDMECAPDVPTKVREINERATLFRITTNAMITACNEFTTLAQSQGKKWQRLLQLEHEKRLRLQTQIEELAKQHSALERAALKETSNRIRNLSPGGCKTLSDEESETFHDAAENVYEDEDEIGEDGGSLHSREANDNDEEEHRKKISDRRITENLLRFQIIAAKSDERPTSLQKSPSQDIVKKSFTQRRKTIPLKLTTSINLWSIMKNCIGKELSKIPMPINFNEPLSMLQRLTEDFEYSNLLDRAANCADACEQMCYVAAFTVSSYASTAVRIGKPFNPLLGETYECDRTEDLGWKAINEQVSHHPPTAAQHVEGRNWILWQEFTMSSKFRGKYLSIIPLGTAHLLFKESKTIKIIGETEKKNRRLVFLVLVGQYSRNVAETLQYLCHMFCLSTIHVTEPRGKLWVDNHGDMTIENNKTGDMCHMKYIPYSYFSREIPRKVTGIVTDKIGRASFVVQGTWDDYIEYGKVLHENNSGNNGSSKPILETTPMKQIWKKHAPIPGSEKIYNFTQLAIELNEPEEGVAPTDCRNRPDQRLMEEGRWDDSNAEKMRLEEKQRVVRRRREAEAEKAVSEEREYKGHEPVWFVKQKDAFTGNVIHVYNGQYWQCKKNKDWHLCPDIY